MGYEIDSLFVSVITVLIAVSGLLTTLAAPLLASRLAHRQTREAHSRDLKIKLYIDAGEHVEEYSRSLDALVDEWELTPHSRPDGIVHSVLLTARINLLAVKAVREAWAALLTAEDYLWWEYREGPSINKMGKPYLDEGARVVVEARQRLSTMREALRAAMNNPDAKS
jgi:hypothetical protein